MKQKIPVFVVSLARAIDRRNAICDHLNLIGIEYRLTNAVDGQTLDAEDINRMLAQDTRMSLGEIGCYLSHINIYREMIEEKIMVALVVEDDVYLDPHIKELIEQGCQSLDWDYCFLDSEDHNADGPIFYNADSGIRLNDTFCAYTLSGGPYCLHAYMITLQAARQRLENAFPIRAPIDHYQFLPYSIHFRALVNPRGAWMSEQHLQSFLRPMSNLVTEVRFGALRRWPIFYRVRDVITLRDLQSVLLTRRLVRQGRLAAGVSWRLLPTGRRLLLLR